MSVVLDLKQLESSKVTVFQHDNAQVNRVVSHLPISSEEKTFKIILDNVSSQMDTNSLRANGKISSSNPDKSPSACIDEVSIYSSSFNFHQLLSQGIKGSFMVANCEETEPIILEEQENSLEDRLKEFLKNCFRVEQEVERRWNLFLERAKLLYSLYTRKSELEKQRREVQQQLKQIDLEIHAWTSELQFLNKYSAAALSVARHDSKAIDLFETKNTDMVMNFVEYEFDHKERIEHGIHNLKQSKTALDEKIQSINKEISQIVTEYQSKVNLPILEGIIALDLGEDYQPNEKLFIDLELEYLIKGASWEPSYDIRVNTNVADNAAGHIYELTYHALILNGTNEDWKQTNISLSTAEPVLRTDPPTLNPLNVDIVRQKYKSYKNGMDYKRKKSAVPLMKESARRRRDSSEKGEESKEMSSLEATAETNPLATMAIFHIPRLTTIAIGSDAKQHKLMITKCELSSKLTHYIVPKLDTNAFVKTKVTNTSSFPLLAGACTIYVDNNFVGNGMMENVNPQEEFESFLGRDSSVKVEYKAPQRYKESSGILIKTNNKVTVTRKVNIKNTKQTNRIELIVRDQIPTSSDEKIKIQVLEPTNITKYDANAPIPSELPTPGIYYDPKDLSVVEWRQIVEPSKEVEFTLKYVTTWSKDVYVDETQL